MGGVALAIAITQLINSLGPTVAEIILMWKRNDGSVILMPIIQGTDEQFAENIKKIKELLESS